MNLGSPEGTIKTLLSATPWASTQIVGDLANSDRLKVFCSDNGIEYIKLGLRNDFSECHNQILKLSKTPWHIHLYPGETLVNPDKINDLVDGPATAYRFPCVQGGWLNKEIRLYHKNVDCKFSRPVFEVIKAESMFAEVYIVGGESPPPVGQIIEKWIEKNPLSLTPRYYKTLSLLMEGKQDEFVAATRQHLFADNKATTDNIMLRYYLACALAENHKTRKECAQQIVECLSANTLMAEFWCLLGDICFSESSCDRAIAFYRNAMTLGSQRRKDDEWPMHIAKYKKHPENMISKCRETLKNTKMFKIKW